MLWPNYIITSSKYYTVNIVNKVIDKIQNTRYSCYLYYIRYYISKAQSSQDLVSILKSISSNSNYATPDNLFAVLTDCLLRYPLTEVEMQKMSTWEQNHHAELGIYNYATTVFWLCAIQAIQENEQKMIKLTN